jgi:hypothetical protein
MKPASTKKEAFAQDGFYNKLKLFVFLFIIVLLLSFYFSLTNKITQYIPLPKMYVYPVSNFVIPYIIVILIYWVIG